MARIQYTPYTKAGGYRPQQVDDRKLARMREESQRQIQGMRENAQAEINNRKEIAQQMKADQAYTKAAEEKNFQIQTANAQREAAGLAAKRQQMYEQYRADAKATEQIFSSVANLSVTAAKTVGEIQKQQKQQDFNRDVNKASDAETDLTRLVNKDLLAQNDIERTAAINEGVAKTGNTKIGAELKANSDAVAYQFTEGQVAHYYKWRYVKDRNSFINLKEKELGRPLTYEEKLAAVGEFRQRLYELHGKKYLSADLVRPYIERYADPADQTFISKAGLQKEKEDDQRRLEMNLTNIGNADPADLNTVFSTAYNHIVDVYNGDRTKAWDEITNRVFLQQNEDGTFVRSLDEIGNLPIYIQGQPTTRFKDHFKSTRWLDIQQKRNKLDLQHRKQMQQLDEIAFAEESDELFKALGPTPSEDQVKEAIDTLGVKYGRTDPRLTLIQKKYTIESQLRAAEAERISNLPDYEITESDLIALKEIADPAEYNAVKQRYDAYSGKWRSKDATDAIKRGLNVITGTTALGTSKAAPPGAAPALRYFENRAIKNAKAMETAMGGAQQALEKAVADEAKLYLSSYRDPTSVYYRKVEQDGSVSYPNLPGAGNISAADKALREVSSLRAMAKTIGIEGVLNVPNSIATAERMNEIALNYGKPGFFPTAKENAFKNMTNGMPLHEIYNSMFQAAGRPERFASPLQSVGINIPPHLQKVLNDPAASRVSKMNAVNVAMGNTGIYSSPSAMRAGSPVGQIIGPNTGIIVTDRADGPGGTDAVIKQGKRGAKYSFPEQGQVLKVVNNRSTEYRLEEGATQRDFGNHVEIRFRLPSGRETDVLVSHFDQVADLKPGDIISPNTFIGTQGRSGSTTGAHVSFDFYKKGTTIPDSEARDWFLKTHLQ
jgi:hypothetical protein